MNHTARIRQIRHQIVNARNQDTIKSGYVVDGPPGIRDPQGLMEWLDLQFDDKLNWQVVNGILAASDLEGWFFFIVPEIEVKLA